MEVEDIRETWERRPAPETFRITSGTIPAGTAAALRFQVQGIVGGRPALVVEHVTRLRDDLAPDWPQHPAGGGYCIDVVGSPSYRDRPGTHALSRVPSGRPGPRSSAGQSKSLLMTRSQVRVLPGVPEAA